MKLYSNTKTYAGEARPEQDFLVFRDCGWEPNTAAQIDKPLVEGYYVLNEVGVQLTLMPPDPIETHMTLPSTDTSPGARPPPSCAMFFARASSLYAEMLDKQARRSSQKIKPENQARKSSQKIKPEDQARKWKAKGA